MPRSRTLLNRLALGVCGLTALAAGAWLSLRTTPWPAPTPLVSPDDVSWLRGHGWWVPSVATASTAATLLLAWWLVRQLRSGHRRRVPLPTSRSHLRTRALEDTIAQHVEDLDGVDRCRPRIRVGTRTGRLDATLRVRLRPDTPPSAVLPTLHRLTSDTEAALAPYRFRMHIHFTARPHRRPHVR
ncbi:hypothetical protein ABZY90_01275 [Streptomyces sp. NPDC006422]|uniref:hypothetical protein n=1 Tax=unclassified Streptomyces TaxID=2593676 RepID=UPI0033A51B00